MRKESAFIANWGPDVIVDFRPPSDEQLQHRYIKKKIGFNGAETNCGIAPHFRHPTDEQLQHRYIKKKGFNGAENCGIAHISGILLMNSYNADIFFSNYYYLKSVHFESIVVLGRNTNMASSYKCFGK